MAVWPSFFFHERTHQQCQVKDRWPEGSRPFDLISRSRFEILRDSFTVSEKTEKNDGWTGRGWNWKGGGVGVGGYGGVWLRRQPAAESRGAMLFLRKKTRAFLSCFSPGAGISDAYHPLDSALVASSMSSSPRAFQTRGDGAVLYTRTWRPQTTRYSASWWASCLGNYDCDMDDSTYHSGSS